jgi:ABC-type multidrug transport system fused ATPase/permease subunit
MIPLVAGQRRVQLLLLLCVALAELAATIIVAESVHRVLSAGSAAVLAGAAITAFALQVLQRRLCEGVGLSYSADVRKALFRHLMSADPDAVRERRHGAMLQSFVGDLTALRQWVSEGLVRGVLALIALVGMLGWLAFSQPRLALLLGGIAVVIIALGAVQLPLLMRAVRAVRRERGRVAAFASERLAAQATVQAFGRARSEARRLERRVERLNRASFRRAWFTGVLRALPHLGTTAMLAAVVIAGGGGGGLGLAGRVVIVGILGLALRDLARVGELVIPGRVAMARIANLLSLPACPAAECKTRKAIAETGLVLDRLQIDQDRRRFTAKAERGDVILLEGEIEATRRLFSVLSGQRKPNRGAVRWNGLDLSAAPLSRRMKLVGLASPELPALDGSAGLNIRYRNRRLSDKQIYELAKGWGVDPKDRTADPTRMVLLRALAGDPPVLLLSLAASPLPDEDIDHLGQAISRWPGVVLMSTAQRRLRQLANRSWHVDRSGLVDQEIAALPGLHLVGPIAGSVM